MNANKVARIVGGLFLIAMVSSLLGGLWLESILSAPDYLGSISANETQVLIGVLLELVNCAAVVFIAAMLFPILRQRNEAMAIGYVGIRVVEAVVLVAAVISPLVLVGLSERYLMTGGADSAYFETLAAVLIAARAHIASLLVPVFFSLGGLLLYSMLYRSNLVPRFISVWGLIAVVSLLTWNLVEAFGLHVSAGMVFGLPIILNEIFLGIWLLVKGFKSTAVAYAVAR